MDTPIAVFDLDDTLTNMLSFSYDALRADYGSRINHWSLWGSFNIEESVGLTNEQFKETCNRHQVVERATPHLFSKYILRDLRLRGFRVVIVTARGGFLENAEEVTADYLANHELEYDDLIVTQHGRNKVDYLRDYGRIHFTVDDQIKNCDDFAESGIVDHVFLMAVPHNKSCTRHIRIHNLYQVFHHIGLE